MNNKIISIKILLIVAAFFSTTNQLFAQCPGVYVPWCTGSNSVTGTQIFGGDATSVAPLQIHMDGPYSIEFYTNNIAGIPIKHMELTKAGDLNLLNYTTISPSTQASNAYQIAGDNVLWHNGITSNIFVGVGAGIINTTGHWNSFIGSAAGHWNTTGNRNTFSGFQAGYRNNIGSDNCYYGYQAGSDSSNLSNATAIGANARVNIDNGFVLGTDKTNVGIRTTAPQYTLEVRGTVAAEKIVLLKENTIKDLQTTIDKLENRIAMLESKLNNLTAKN